jgi:hypothetical protein
MAKSLSKQARVRKFGLNKGTEGDSSELPYDPFESKKRGKLGQYAQLDKDENYQSPRSRKLMEDNVRKQTESSVEKKGRVLKERARRIVEQDRYEQPPRRAEVIEEDDFLTDADMRQVNKRSLERKKEQIKSRKKTVKGSVPQLAAPEGKTGQLEKAWGYQKLRSMGGSKVIEHIKKRLSKILR